MTGFRHKPALTRSQQRCVPLPRKAQNPYETPEPVRESHPVSLFSPEASAWAGSPETTKSFYLKKSLALFEYSVKKFIFRLRQIIGGDLETIKGKPHFGGSGSFMPRPCRVRRLSLFLLKYVYKSLSLSCAFSSCADAYKPSMISNTNPLLKTR